MDCWQPPLTFVAVLGLAASGGAGCRSELLALDGAEASAGGGTTTTTTTTTPDLPPPPPDCEEVRFDACESWSEPLIVSLPTETGRRPDLAWQGQVHLVAYFDGELERTITAAVTPDGQVLWREPLGELETPRIAYSPKLNAGMVAGRRGLHWLSAAGTPNGSLQQTGPFGGTAMNADVGATQTGFTIIVSPTSAPGGPPPGHFASLGSAPGEVVWQIFYENSPNPSIEHSTGADGLVHRFGFEAFAGVGSMELVAFALDGSTPVGPVGAPYDLGSGTNFTDGMASDGPFSFFLKTSGPTLTFVAMHTDGSNEVYSMVTPGDNWRPHLERLGTATALGEIVVASPGLLAEDAMAVATWSPELGLGAGLVLGPGGRDPRLARTARGLSLTWTHEGAVLLQQLDCCVVP